MQEAWAEPFCCSSGLVFGKGHFRPVLLGVGRFLHSKHLSNYEERIKINKIAESKYLKILSITKSLKTIEKELKRIKRSKMTYMFECLSDRITTSFLKLSNMEEEISQISLVVSGRTDVSLEFSLELKNGRITKPEQILSEANLDLLALIVRVEALRYASDNYYQAKVLILDDVFQSVDSVLRRKFISFILVTLAKWQFIITAHDRLWYEQLTQIFNSHNHQFIKYEIAKWNSQSGIQIDSNRGSLLKVYSFNKLDRATPADASILLEKICSHLSVNLPVSVTRRTDDKYTLGDLWPPINKVLKKYDEISDIVKKLDGMIYLRNIIGGHYNEWAISLSDAELSAYVDAIHNFYHFVYCESCNSWIQELRCGNTTIGWKCQCGKLNISKKTN